MLNLPAVATLLTILYFGAQAQGEQKLGPLYECAHDLKGNVWVVNEKKIVIKNFSYDGRGPAAWFHAQLRPAEEISSSPKKGSGFVTLPFPGDNCDKLSTKVYDNSTITLILPRSIKEFHTIGVLCYKFCHNFGNIVIPENLTVPPAPVDQLSVSECPVPPYPACTRVNQGALKDCAHP